MAGRSSKISVETWIETAKRSLIEDGISGVKIDRLANRLGVTRGGFYHNFRDRDALLDKLIEHWEATCRFLPVEAPPPTAAEAALWLDQVVGRLIEGDGYDCQFDLAMREWSRSDRRAEWAVERADRKRLITLRQFFQALGYDSDAATVRARVFYYHQIGYYAIGVRETIAGRRRSAPLYTEILCGEHILTAARASARREMRQI